MKQRFTQLIAQASQAKRYIALSGVFLFALITTVYLWAAITPITPVNVSATVDQAQNGATPGFVGIGDVVIREEIGGDFNTSTLVLKVEDNWRFNPNSGTAVSLRSSGGNINSNRIFRPTISTDNKTLTFNITYNNSGNNTEAITISGIQVQPISGAVPLPSTGTVFIEGNANISGLGSNTTVANLTMAAGAARGLAFRQQPTNTAIGATINPAPQVAVVDQFGNTVTTGPGATASVALAIGTNPGGGTLSGTNPVAAVNGVATFSNLRIDLPGDGYTLIASSGTLAQATSNAFVVNNQRPTITSVTPECISQGDPATTLTITGTNFGTGAVVLINGSERPATVASRTSLTTTVTETELAAAGTLSIVVRNPTGPPHNGLASEAFSKTVVPLLTPGDVAGAASVCVNSTGNYSIAAVSGATSYQWTVVSGSATITAGATAATATLSFGEEAGTVVLSVTALNACGKPGAPANFTVAVNAFPVAEIEASGPVEFCAEGTVQLNVTPVEGASYQWQLNGDDIEDAIGTSFVADASGDYRVVVTTNGCATNSNVITVTENPLPVVTLAPIEAVCISAAPFALTGGDPANGNYSGTGVVDGIFDPAVAGVGDHEITYTFTNGNGCTNTATQTIIVKALPEVTVSPNTEVCAGERTTLTASGATTYRWEPTTGIEGPATGASINVRPTETTTYTVYGTTDGCESVAQTVTVVVNPLPNVTITPIGPTEFCPENYVELVVENVVGYNYQWFSTASEAPVGNASSYQATTTGTYYVTVRTDKGCTLTSTPIAVKVADVPDEATILVTGSTTFCEGGFVRFSANQAPPGQIYLYQWEFSENGTDFEAIAGAQDRVYEAEDEGFYRVVVSNTNEEDEDTQLCTKTSLPQEVTVLPQPTANIVAPAPAARTICQNSAGTTSFTVTGIYSGTDREATWTSNNANFTVSGSNDVLDPVTGEVTSTVIVNASRPGTATITLQAQNATTACNTATSTITLTVQPFIANNTITGTAAYCQNATATPLITAGTLSGGTGNYTYLWEQSTDETTWGAAAGTNNVANYTPSTATAGTIYYRRTIISGTCTSTSNTFAVTVTPSITENTIAGVQAYCQGAEATALGGAVAGGTGAYTYQWQSSSSATGTFTNITSATAATYTPSTATAGTVYYRRLVTSGECANNVSNVIGVTVTPAITANTISGAATYCQGATASALGGAVTGGVNAKTYQWQQSPNGSDQWTTAPGTSNQISYTPSTTTLGTIYYRRVVTSENCSSESNAVAIIVNSPIAGNQISGAQTVCSNSPVAALGQAAGTSLSGGSTPYTFQWQTSTSASGTFTNVTNGTGANTATYTPASRSVTSSTTVYFRRVVSGGQCESFSEPVAVTFTPVISNNTITATQTTICSEGTPTQINGSLPTGGTGTYTYLWEQRVGANGAWVAAAGTNNGRNYQPGALTTTTSFRRVVSSSPCNAITSPTVTITVNPVPTVSFSGLNDGDIFYTGGSSVTLTGSPTGGTFSGPGINNTTRTFSPCAAGPGTHTIRYAFTNGQGCTSFAEKTVTVRESQYRVVVISSLKPFCQGDNVNHEAWIVRDAESIIYPYLTNANGDPVDASGRLIGPLELPVANPNYPFPANTPDIIKQNAYRYFNPIINFGANGVRLESGFTYQWTKNQENNIGPGTPIFSNAGLSSLDYYAVYVTSNTTACGPNFNRRISSRTYTSQLYNYDITLTANSNPICPGDAVTFTANLNSEFPFWSNINLVLEWRINGTTFNTTRYSGNADALTWTTVGPNRNFVQGDVVTIVFTSDTDSQDPLSGNCAGGTTSTEVTMNVNTVPAITSTTVNAACVGNTATLSVNATGTGLTYQWFKRASDNPNSAGSLLSNGGRISGATSATLNIASATAADAGLYYVEVRGTCPPVVTSQNLQLNITPLPTVYDITSSATSYCAGSGVTIGLSGSEPNTTYNLLRNGTQVATVTRTASQSGAFNFTGSFTAGTYAVRAITVASQPGRAACPRDMSGSITVAENPLPLAIAATGGSYCEVTTEYPSSGAMVTISNSQSGVAYQLLNSSGQLVGSSANGTGGEITLGPVLAGTYSIRGTNGTTGCTTTVGQATVIEDKRIEPKGDIIITNEAGEVIESKQLESGKLARFTASNTFEDNGDAISYTWYTGDGEDGNWVVVPEVNGPVLTIQSIPGGTFAVRVDVVADESACYTVYAGRYTTVPAVPLPVEIIYFTAAKQGNNVLLEWATASEENNTGFEVQVSQDGFNFRKLDFVPTKNGNTVIKQVYQYNDKENGKRGTRYYRLKQIDEDGRFEYFTTKAVTFSEVASKVKAFPNPFTTKITLDIAAENSGQVQVTMWNAVGRQLMEQTVVVEEGFNTVNLDIRGDLPHGVYFLRVYLDGKMHQIKMLRE
ncbi:putative secreted protein (Por secretion system target) [Pontibacter mucosus]|uniref:Putative secreted protein (Por secretion system target) n=1 Tax=Pontibacter mucosus TaxID=1649266 RepID=A0A2T5YJ29_9BACT|nr:T9SS type A sorting domain-containing protein [Pontibacter mucosus]PTX19317.1 putative secreted protein (Por secretion system target) [Pontibacter mucosus]